MATLERTAGSKMALKRRRPSSTRRSESDTALLQGSGEQLPRNQEKEVEGLKAELSEKIDTLKSKGTKVRFPSVCCSQAPFS